MAQTVTFESWMARVNLCLDATVGLTHLDLPDLAYRDMYDDGATARDACRAALREAGYDGKLR